MAETIGDRLRRIRRDVALTQEQLADSSGVSKDLISMLERNRRQSARITTLAKLANALGVEMSELLDKRPRLEGGMDASVLTIRDALLSPAYLPGPVEYLVLAFPDGNVSDEIAVELGNLADKKAIRILDAVVITKDTSGDVAAAEFDELEGMTRFAEIDAEVGGLIGPDDISFVGADLDPGAAAVLLVEDLWAAPLASAFDRCGGFLIEGARIPHDLVEAAVAGLPAAS
jgi:transcriptional regulator with XRE-family HTH domain